MAKKIEDFGAKIEGARKDTWKARGLRGSDLAEMNNLEVAAYAKKDNVWPKPDYEKMMADGMPLEVAWFRKSVRDSLPAKPVYVRGDTDDPARKRARETQFTETVQQIREMTEQITTMEQAETLFGSFLLDEGYIEKRDAQYYLMPKGSENPVIKNKLFQAMRPRPDWAAKLQAEAKRKKFHLPAAMRPPAGYRIVKALDGTFYASGKKSQFGFESYEMALEWAKEQARQERSSRTAGKYVPPQLEKIERTGPDVRQGADITGEEYLTTFGFRGGQFGNWLNQSDRQQSLNMGFEALKDLAAALGVEDKDISLDGGLGIAFGARGKGSALAHYEPMQQVINLTKMKGAGSLAHEWFHALDHFLGMQAEKTGFLTDPGARTDRPDAPVPQTAADALVKAMNRTEDGGLTQYYIESSEFEGKKSRYWTTNREMAARAFACYVADKIAETGGRSDYLTGHAEINKKEDRHCITCCAFPRGDERQAINAAFDQLFDDLKERGLLHQRQEKAQEQELVHVEVDVAPAPSDGKPAKKDAREAAAQAESAQQQPETPDADTQKSGAEAQDMDTPEPEQTPGEPSAMQPEEHAALQTSEPEPHTQETEPQEHKETVADGQEPPAPSVDTAEEPQPETVSTDGPAPETQEQPTAEATPRETARTDGPTPEAHEQQPGAESWTEPTAEDAHRPQWAQTVQLPDNPDRVAVHVETSRFRGGMICTPDRLKAFLDFMADNPGMAPKNALVAQLTLPDARNLHSEEGWRVRGGRIMENAESAPMLVGKDIVRVYPESAVEITDPGKAREPVPPLEDVMRAVGRRPEHVSEPLDQAAPEAIYNNVVDRIRSTFPGRKVPQEQLHFMAQAATYLTAKTCGVDMSQFAGRRFTWALRDQSVIDSCAKSQAVWFGALRTAAKVSYSQTADIWRTADRSRAATRAAQNRTNVKADPEQKQETRRSAAPVR